MCALAALAVGVASFHAKPIQRLDVRAYAGFGALIPDPPRYVERAAHAPNPRPFALFAAAILGIAALRRRLAAAAAAAVLLVAAPATTVALKWLTDADRPAPGLPEGLWPSGHVTATMALAVALVLVVPLRLRPLAAAAAALAAAGNAIAVLVVGTHLTTDVLGAVLVTGTWSGLVLAVHGAKPGPGLPARASLLPVGLAGALAAAALVTLVARADMPRAYAADPLGWWLAAAVVCAAPFLVMLAVSLAATRGALRAAGAGRPGAEAAAARA